MKFLSKIKNKLARNKAASVVAEQAADSAEIGVPAATPQEPALTVSAPGVIASAAQGEPQVDDPGFTLTMVGADWKSLQKDLSRSLEESRVAAATGDSEAQYALGVAYAEGEGVEKDLSEAFRWFVKAAGHDHAKAQYRLGLAYEQGLGIAKSTSQAFTWYTNAANLGDADAQFSLGVAHVTGSGAEHNLAKAIFLFHKAAAQGHAKAQFNLGSLYCNGEGVEKDVREAAEFYQKAAAQGHARAQHNLGWLYSKGLGVTKNYAQAVIWFARSAEQGYEPATRNLNETIGQLQTFPILTHTTVRARPEPSAVAVKSASPGETAYIISSFGLWHEVYFKDRNILGYIPASPSLEESETPEPAKRIEMRLGELRERKLLPPLEQDHRISNEFRAIKRQLLGNMLGRSDAPVDSGNVIMVSSALPSEGKTVCTLNLSLALAMERDYKVVLIDGDVVNPTISRSLGVEQEPGLLDVLRTPDGDLADVEIATGIAGLSVVPAGRRDADAPELLSSNRMQALLDKMKLHPNRIYLFDSTPILLTNESRSLSEMVGQIVFVVRAGVTPRNAVKTALSFMPKNTFIGLVLNHKSGSDHGEAYYYYYDYYKPAVDSPRAKSA